MFASLNGAYSFLSALLDNLDKVSGNLPASIKLPIVSPPGKRMIKPWIFEFLYALAGHGDGAAQQDPTAVYDKGIALWKRLDELDFEGIFFSEHHFGLSYSPSPNLLIAAIAHATKRLRLGTMGLVLPLYQPWRVLEEVGSLDHITRGRREIRVAR